MEDTDRTKDSILQRLKVRAEEMQVDAVEKIATLSGAGAEELRGKIADLDEITVIINALGYSIDNIRIGIGLIPDVVMSISGLTRTIPEEDYNRILEEQKDRPLLINVVKGLQTASALQHKIHIMGMRADSASITIGVPPKIALDFKREA